VTPAELEAYLHAHIPLSAAMAVRVLEVGPEAVRLWAPLEPNINHRSTVFGGSASAVAILAAWSLLHTRLLADGVAARLVIQRNTMDYLAPIAGNFTATATLAAAADWSLFCRTLDRHGRARIEAVVRLDFEQQDAGRLTGSFVALGGRAIDDPPVGTG